MTCEAAEARYRAQFARLERAADELKGDLQQSFADDPWVVGVEARAKAPDSFVAKAAKTSEAGAEKYPEPLIDIQDQIGCRIIVASPRAVDDVIAQLRLHFGSIEQVHRARLDPSTFGYEAWHLICLVPESLKRRHRLDAVAFEIQISTLFQHAWAAMNHDLIYKSRQGEPTFEQKRAVAAAAAMAYAADLLFEHAQDRTAEPKTPTRRPGRARRAVLPPRSRRRPTGRS